MCKDGISRVFPREDSRFQEEGKIMELEDMNFEWFLEILKDHPDLIQELIEIWEVE